MNNKDKIYDVVIIGAGHNGLVCAGYLAKAGLKVIIFEQWPRVGGCAQTEELIPGFKINPCSVDHILIQSTPILKELELESRFGLKYLKIDPIFSVPFPDGKYFLIYEDLEKTCKSIGENISQKDAENYRNFVQFWMKGLELLSTLFFVPLYPLKSALLNLSHKERKELLGFVIKDGDTFLDIVRAIFMSPKLLLDDWFETEYVKAPIAWTACNFGLPPSQSGMGLMTSFPVFAHYSGCKRPEGGSGMLSQALARMVEHYGGTIKVESPVKKVIVDNGNARGVILESGEEVEAQKAVISAMSPRKLFLELIDKDAIPSDFRKKIENLQADQATGMKLDLALSELPKFEKCGGNSEITIGSPMICPSIEYLEKAYDEVKYGEPPKDPCFWAAVPTAVDPTLAPQGKHILYLYGIGPQVLSGGRKWEDIKDEYAERIIDKMEEYIPNLRSIIIDRYIQTPDDLKDRIGDFNPTHIDYYLDQNLIFRPTRELSGYRTPIKGLYVSASGTHPGGGVGGIPGHNTAKTVLEDIRGKGVGSNIAKSISIIYEVISLLLSGKSKK
jgi:beta-carotene ketolase (CrtO type)